MKAKKLLKRAVLIPLILIGLSALSAVILVVFSLESAPRVPKGKALTTADVGRARRLISEHDPRKLEAGETRTMTASERDINIVAQYALSRLPMTQNVRARVALSDGAADADLSIRIPQNPIGEYLNLSLAVGHDGPSSGDLKVRSARIGKISLKGWMIRPVLSLARTALSPLPPFQDAAAVTDGLKSYDFEPDGVRLVYEWDPTVAERLKARGRNLLISDDDRKRLLAYNDRLADAVRSVGGKPVSLSRVMESAFSLAHERAAGKGDPILENRAAIVALTFLANRRSMAPLFVAEERDALSEPKRIKATLRNRHDLARHFIISAALAATADSGLANAAGLFKEIDDSRGGSGFSFADLAADRAGVRFAELAVGSRDRARRLQNQLLDISGESDFMPRIDGLPEGLQEKTFKRRYQDLDSAAYRDVRAEIERRIDACGIHR